LQYAHSFFLLLAPSYIEKLRFQLMGEGLEQFSNETEVVLSTTGSLPDGGSIGGCGLSATACQVRLGSFLLVQLGHHG